MLVNLLRSIHSAANRFASFLRLVVPRLLGLRTGSGLQVGGSIQWPLGNVRNLVLGANVSLGARGWLYIPLGNKNAVIKIGAGSAIGNDFVITANNSIKIGSDCLLSYRVTVMDHAHVTGPGVGPVKSGITDGKPIEIGDKCFIGCNAVIMPGVILGENCVVGANSVVTKGFPAGSVVAGAPAKLIRSLPLAGS